MRVKGDPLLAVLMTVSDGGIGKVLVLEVELGEGEAG